MPIFLSLMALAIAAPDCPAKIEVKQTLASHLPGWSVGTDDAPHLLAGMTFFDGNPGEKPRWRPIAKTLTTEKLYRAVDIRRQRPLNLGFLSICRNRYRAPARTAEEHPGLLHHLFNKREHRRVTCHREG